MRKIKYILFVILLFLAINVKADSNCDKNELARLKELARKVEFDYSYKLVDEKAVFSINAVNTNEELKLIVGDILGDYREFDDNGSNKASLNDLKPGERVTIKTLAFVPNFCSFHELTSKTIILPYYNYYYDEEKCKGNEDFKYCKLLINSNITQSEFDRQFELYLKNKQEKGDNPIAAKEDNTGLYITIVAIVLAIIVVVLIIVNIVNRRKKNRL